MGRNDKLASSLSKKIQTGFVGLFFALLQVIYSRVLFDSFELPKWLFASVSLFFIITWTLIQTSDQKDYQWSLPGLKILFFVWLFLFVARDFFSENLYAIYTLGVGFLFYSLVYFQKRIDFSLSEVSFFLYWVIISITFLEFFGLIPMFQGNLYHLSGFCGNPNLLAACIVFWDFLNRKNEQIGIEDVTTLMALGFCASRAAIFIWLFLRFLKIFFGPSKKIFLLFFIFFTLVAIFMIRNPFHFQRFSAWQIRAQEISLSLSILRKNIWFGIGSERYRQEYSKELESYFLGVSSWEENEKTRYSRLSSKSHFSLLHPFLFAGIPGGLIFFYVWFFLLRESFTRLYFYEKKAVISVLLMSQFYFLFEFCVLLLPFLFVISKGLSRGLILDNKASAKRYIVLLPLLLFCLFFIFQYLYQKDLSDGRKEFLIQAAMSPFDDGEALHRLGALFLLSEPEKRDMQDLEPLIVGLFNDSQKNDFLLSLFLAAHRKKPDPSTFYHLAMLEYRRGNMESAKLWIKKGIEWLPSYALFYYALSLLVQEPQIRLKNLFLAVNMQPSLYQAWKSIFEIKREQNDQEAFLFLQKAMDAWIFAGNSSKHPIYLQMEKEMGGIHDS